MRLMKYRRYRLEDLLEVYADENQRVNREDAYKTQKLVVNELYMRLKTALDLLDECEPDEVNQIIRQYMLGE